MSEKIWNVLVLCTGNSARSIMSEAAINVLGKGRFHAYSAGSQPTGKVNPFAIEQAQTIGYDTTQVRSKSWDEFSHPNSPKMDIVITVCDSAAGEACPLWIGSPLKIHWGFEDPSHIQGDDEAKRQAFAHTFKLICTRMQQLVDLPLEQLSKEEQKLKLEAIAEEA